MLTPGRNSNNLPSSLWGGYEMADNAKVRRRPDTGKWYVELWWGGKRYRRSHYDDKLDLETDRIAQRLADSINTDIDRKGKGFDPRQWFTVSRHEYQLDYYIERWLSKNQTRYAPAVRRDVGRYCGYATSFFGDKDIREIRNFDLERFLDSLPAHLSLKTKKNALGLVHKIFADAHRHELIERIPGFPVVSAPEPEVKSISAEWQAKIIEAIPERDRPIFVFMAAWGFRPGEARALQWEDVDFERETITVRRTFSGSGCNHLQNYTKTKRIRHLPFTDDLRSVFKRVRGIAGFVFRNKDGRPYTSDVSRTWNTARDQVGAPKVTLSQGTRHSFATQHLDKLDIVRQVLGHTRTDMTRRYQALNLEKMRQLKT